MLGEGLALAAAACWSVAVILFKQSDRVGAARMNLFKNGVGVVLLAVTLLALGGRVELERAPTDWARLAASGVLGIAIADTLELEALRRLGAGPLAIVNLAYAPIIVGLSVAVLDEELGPSFLLGAPLVVGGVGLAVLASGPAAAQRPADRRGWALGLMAMAAMGVGVVLAKPVLAGSDLIEVTLVRLVFGVGAQSLVLLAVPAWRGAFSILRPSAVWRTLLPAAVLGTYLAMLLWLGGFKHADVSVASVLNQLATVFTLVLARVWLGETLRPRQAIGAALAFVGALVILG
jgi:drug/metabolite transporter (DMT)-like permease